MAKPGPGTVRYGGNTSCVEVRSAGDDALEICRRVKESGTHGTPQAHIVVITDRDHSASRLAEFDPVWIVRPFSQEYRVHEYAHGYCEPRADGCEHSCRNEKRSDWRRSINWISWIPNRRPV